MLMERTWFSSREFDGKDRAMSYTPVLFQTIAKDVAKSYAEQYLVSFADGSLTVMFSTPAIEDAIEKASAKMQEIGALGVLAAEFNIGRGFVAQDYIFADECDGVMNVDGVLVEVSIRKIREGVHRVLFARVDSARLYQDVSGRLAALEKTVASLATAS